MSYASTFYTVVSENADSMEEHSVLVSIKLTKRS